MPQFSNTCPPTAKVKYVLAFYIGGITFMAVAVLTGESLCFFSLPVMPSIGTLACLRGVLRVSLSPLRVYNLTQARVTV